ncbi:hypothetical protein BFP77_00060 [Maribacter sp. 4U21]|uniref:hypothetical protein n=1 Tax=Maribacter sp. 4U21 TaxID=1889779 RepID=UPI000C14C08F|nr:hypothetical protein [Maribacter sp. 4U21]PIB28370.1 hypothetical protein BFP77_00060 [Maribacter sp. 4U21]
MKTQKLSLHDFEAVGTAELLSVKGGLSSKTENMLKQLSTLEYYRNGGNGQGSSGGGCGPGHPFNEQGMVDAFKNMMQPVGEFGDWVMEGMEVLQNNAMRSAEWLLESRLPVALPPVLPGVNNPSNSAPPNMDNIIANCN